MKRDLVIIGGGPAGLAAAVAAYDAGVKDVLVLEREEEAGGVLKQCIHNGFGLTRFRENMTGPEYAQRFLDEARARNIEILTGAFVVDLSSEKTVTYMNGKGVFTVRAGAVILAMGCRERSKGALNIAGTRPAGLFSAGTAQKFVNIYGLLPGKRVLILGSGDIGLIMARRLTLEGAEVLGVVEIMPCSSGLKRNIAQCLDDFGIPLYLRHTVVEIEGDDRVSGALVAEVDENRLPIAGTRGALVDSDRETEIEGIFACGNVLHVHDLVDFVSEEAEIAGRAAAKYLLGGHTQKSYVPTRAGENVSYVLPQKLCRGEKDAQKLYFRVRSAFPNAKIIVRAGDTVKEFRRIAVAPGEMEHVSLPPALFDGAENVEISVVREG